MIKEWIKQYIKQKYCNHSYIKNSTEYGIDYSGFKWKRESCTCTKCQKRKFEKFLV